MRVFPERVLWPGPAAILMRLPRGIVLAKDPWGDEIGSMDPNYAAARSILLNRDSGRLLKNECRRTNVQMNRRKEQQNEQSNEIYTLRKRNVSVPLHRGIATDLSREVSSEGRASCSEYCSGSRCLGRWFWLESRLRHSCQRWLQRQHRSRAGDLLPRRRCRYEAHARSTRWTVYSCGSQLRGSGNYRSRDGSIGRRFGVHRCPHARCWRE